MFQSSARQRFSIRGIPIAWSWTAGLLVAVIGWSFWSAWTKPVPAIAAVVAVVVGVVAVASVLAHELGHSLVARRRGVPVQAITLWALGGIAHLNTDPQNPKDQTAIAAAGPAVSAGLAGLFGAAAAVWFNAGLDTVVGWGLLWLMFVNVGLCLFNLLPGLPLDGGQLVEAYFWKRDGDPVAARLRAANWGKNIGMGMIVLGLLGVIGIGPFSLWTAMVGLFVRREAAAIARRTRGGDVFTRMADLFNTAMRQSGPRTTPGPFGGAATGVPPFGGGFGAGPSNPSGSSAARPRTKVDIIDVQVVDD